MSPPLRVAPDSDPLPAGHGAAPSATLRRSLAAALIQDAARRNFNVYFLLPISLIVLSAMVALVGGILWLTALQNRAEEIKERERVKASFMTRIESVQATTRVFAVWDDAAERLVATVDPAWADTNVGGYGSSACSPPMPFWPGWAAMSLRSRGPRQTPAAAISMRSRRS